MLTSDMVLVWDAGMNKQMLAKTKTKLTSMNFVEMK